MRCFGAAFRQDVKMTDASNWQRIEALLDAVLDKPTAQRAAWLRDCDAPEAIRHEVQRLLAAADASTGWLEGHGDTVAQPTLQPGELAGTWRVVRPLGRGGMDGRVDNFFWQRFGTALLFSLVDDAATVGSEAIGNSASNTTRVPSDAASTILQQNSQIKPVLRKNQGEDVGITVAQDFDFSAVYGLSLK